ncbi:MAG: hypothetical protein CFH19_00572 [Alphaproteobacteria bacterium MarineAlpha5_Bin9]|nr:MAG: hypothetical protein CFH19_00572 [Alphaproteobacteria bacterium MarineAlpha5_Bin9]|tara:strand:+ start:14814 stop:14993 length:180 start_codon:yes stop_codon:yes gene_type:complete
MEQKNIKLLHLNIAKLEKLIEKLTDNLEIRDKKIEFLKSELDKNIRKIDDIIREYNAKN